MVGILQLQHVAVRKRLRLSYVAQDSKFKPEDTVGSVVERALRSVTIASEHDAHFSETLGRAGFDKLLEQQRVGHNSAGF